MSLTAPPQPAILVTGGAGYIGAQVCKALAVAGFLPVTIDNLSTGHREAVKWGPLVEADIRDRAAVMATLGGYHVVGAMHFAAFSVVPESVAKPLMYYDNNLVAGLAFAGYLIEAGVRVLVFSSTAAVYGVPDTALVVEDHPTRPINPYGATKLAFEEALRAFGAVHDFRSVTLRYFNAAGADLDAETGECHEPETHLVPNVLRAALGFGPALKIFGTDYPTRDGTAVRDYIHVVDIAAAHVLAIRHLLEGGESLTLNIGSNDGISVAEVIAATEAATGRPLAYEAGPRRAGDPPTLIADAAALRRRLGWTPRHSDIKTIITSALAWHVRQGR